VVALGLGIALVLRQQGPNDSSDNKEYDDESLVPVVVVEEGYYEYLLDLLIQQTPSASSLMLQQDPTSPQHLALNWMVYQDSLHLREPNEVLQRYALVFLYFATGGVDFWDEEWLRPHVNECYFEGVLCDDDSHYSTDVGMGGTTRESQTNHIPDATTNDATTTTNSVASTTPQDTKSNPPHRTITELNLKGRALVGPLPHDVGLLTGLRSLDLSFNGLEGPIPLEIFTQLTQLQFLDLSDNGLVGTIPSHIDQLTDLRVFSLNGNYLTGLLPMNLPRYLEVFVVIANLLEGPLERMFQSTTNVTNTTTTTTATTTVDPGTPAPTAAPTLTTSITTNITGSHSNNHTTIGSSGGTSGTNELFTATSSSSSSLPVTVVGPHLQKLRILDVGLNGLSGTIPSILGQLTNLLMLGLSANRDLRGTFPSELGRLTSLGMCVQCVRAHVVASCIEYDVGLFDKIRG
jgi:hypothetical protein